MSSKAKKQKEKRKAEKQEKIASAPLPVAAVSLKDRGNKAFVEKNFVLAVEMYTKAIEEERKEKTDTVHTLLANRSVAWREQKQYVDALNDAEMVVKMKPDWARGHLRRAQALKELMRLPEAVASFEKARQLDPNDEITKKEHEELLALVNEIKVATTEMGRGANPEKDKFHIMIEWLRAGNAKFPYLSLQYYDEDYRGVHAVTRIPTDAIVLEVPLPLIMTSDVAKESEIGKKVINSGVKLRSTHSYLACYLCQEKNRKNSYWTPYINILPVNYRNMPIFFDEDELKYLRGSFSLKKIADRKEDLLAEYENICKNVPDFKVYTYKEFVWARLAVITRIFGLVINGNKTDGLVPMADMLNHKRPRGDKNDKDDSSHSETSWTFDDKRNGFIITSLKSLNRGDQIFDSYGRKCNSRFFVNYGFSLEDNEDNQAVIPVDIPTTDPHYPLKLSYLGGHASACKRRFQIPIQYKEKEAKEAFSFTRFALAQDSEIMLLGGGADGAEFKVDDIEPISIRNEIAVLRVLADSAAKQLARFESTVDEDNKLLADPEKKLTTNIRNAILMRRGEKEVLMYYIQLAKEVVPLLEKPWKDLKKVAAKCSTGKGKFDQYITAVVVPLGKAGGNR
jgi:histone-lysine N-methyltransferase SETD3